VIALNDNLILIDKFDFYVGDSKDIAISLCQYCITVVWNALPSAVNFISLNVLGIALKRLIFRVLLFVCNILLMW